MQRDWELIRDILTRIEALPDTRSKLLARNLPEWSAEAVNYHLRLMIEAGLIEGHCTSQPGGGMVCYATMLTWKGHEFMDTVRSDTAWNRIKARLAEKSIDLSFDAIVAAGQAVLGMLGG
ncbi:DUF2513 domain-containing protein [Methylococcus mesophilus]|uniref:DUF2513 domain-containing protein n=1 Tax=Methylococcus mesophilus TaxID=2993564 RepID=UPI00224B2614|nr:DUF2513 domain-containing protein [Methylococcus mesophilus]UZR29096.1 DUF2513 domain-containing protein [Methylococcus mesophilus]